MSRISARDYLLRLPQWFTVPIAAAVSGVDAKVFRVYLSRWKKLGLVEPFGSRTQIYFNRVLCPQSVDHLRIPALKHLYPEATLTGVSVLHAAGWITQIPAQTQVAILALGRTHLKPEGFVIQPRARAWFLNADLVSGEQGQAGLGLRETTPAWALADLINQGTALDADDLYLDDTDRLATWRACQKLGDLRDDPFIQELVQKMLREEVERVEARGEARGKVAGKSEGRTEGRTEEGLNLLRKLLIRRFGVLPAWAEEKIAEATLEHLETWVEQVLDAETLAAVFE